MDRETIERCLREVGLELAHKGLTGEILIVGGAFMTLVLRSREATRDVDAYLDPAAAQAIREAVRLTTLQDALWVGMEHIPERLLAPRVRYLLEELFEETDR